MAVKLGVIEGIENNSLLFENFKQEHFLFSEILKYSTDGIVVLNKKKQILASSETFNKLTEKGNLIGENFYNVISKITQLPDDFFNESTYFININTQGITKVYETKILKIKNEFQETERFIIILKDVNSQEEVAEEKNNFIATLTHDLKTPILAGNISLQLLLKEHFGKLNQNQREILEELQNSNKYVLNMLDTLLTKYKYENNAINLCKTTFCMNELIKSIVKEVQSLFSEKNITCYFNFNENIADISGDKLELKRALVNILSNAIKFNKENGKITISTKINDNNIEINIGDTGIGMDEEKMKHIFNKYISYAKCFRQLGTGLGLYVAKQIIEAHGGNISVVSKSQIGSNFTIILPL